MLAFIEGFFVVEEGKKRIEKWKKERKSRGTSRKGREK